MTERPSRTAKDKALRGFQVSTEHAQEKKKIDGELPCPPPLRERIMTMGRGYLANKYPSPSYPSGSASSSGNIQSTVGRGLMNGVVNMPGAHGDSEGPFIRSKQQMSLSKTDLLSYSQSESSDSGEDDAKISSENESSSEQSDSSDCDDDDAGTKQADLIGKDGTQWLTVSGVTRGRLPIQNVFKQKPGPTYYCRNVEEPIDSVRLFLDDGLLRFICECTVEYARHEKNETFSLTLMELECFIGLMYIRGAMTASNYPYDMLWSDEFGCDKFKQAMTRNRFREIKKYLRFDVRATRSHRLKENKFALISSVHDRLVENFQRAYIPHQDLCIDEQLFPTKSRCSFTQYISSKPDKFGIKNWILADVETKYCLNVIPYVGKEEGRTTGLGEHVVMSLMTPFLNKGHNVCMDNFFTSHQLATNLLARSTSLVGTIRGNRREIPAAARTKVDLYGSQFYQSGQVLLVSYQAKKNRQVYLLSTLHRGNVCDKTSKKKKPEAICDYNKQKCGVDLLNSMCKAMTTKIGSRRWPFAVFCNYLDICGINAWIIYREKLTNQISRRSFLFEIGRQLTAASGTERNMTVEKAPPVKLETRTNCKVLQNCNRNRASGFCTVCSKAMCGPCQAKICVACQQQK